jgi:hypothetical protein
MQSRCAMQVVGLHPWYRTRLNEQVLSNSNSLPQELVIFFSNKTEFLATNRDAEGTGSMMLNKRFEDSLKSNIGDEELFPYKKTPGYRKALKEFEENIKPKYSSSGPSTFKIQFPGASFTPDASCRLERNALTLTK